MEKDYQILQYNSTNPLLDCVISREAKRVVTVEHMTLFPISGAIMCGFSHTEDSFMHLYPDIPTWPKLVNFLKRFGRTLY